MAFRKKSKTGGGKSAFILMVGDEGAILTHLQKKTVVRRLFAQSPDPAHVRGFEAALNAVPRAPVTMIVDMMDQSYVRQTLPPVSSLSVGKIVKRRLDKDFSRDDIKGYIILDREKTGRRDWNYLMASLANPPGLQKWISFASERSNPFRGMGLAPLESQAFVMAIARSFLPDKKAQPLEWQILVSHNKVSGFRQVVLKNGKLVFTRMAQSIGESNPEVIAGNIEQEMQNTQEYLKRMGLQDPATLSVIVVASSDIRQALDPKNIKAGEYHFLTPHEAANALALTDAALPEDHFGDVVLSAFIGRKRKLALPLNTPYTQKLRKLSTYIAATRVAGALAVLGVVAWMGMSGWDILSLKSDTEALENQQKRLKNELMQVKKQADALPKEVGRYTDIMAFAKAVSKRRYDPLVFISDFAKTLQEAALVKSCHWTLSDPLALEKNPDKRQIQAEIELKLMLPEQPHEQFVAGAQQLMERIKKAFPDFDVSHSELPGILSDTQEFKAVLGGPAATAPANANTPSDNVVKITIKGPQSEAGKNGH